MRMNSYAKRAGTEVAVAVPAFLEVSAGRYLPPATKNKPPYVPQVIALHLPS